VCVCVWYTRENQSESFML